MEPFRAILRTHQPELVRYLPPLDGELENHERKLSCACSPAYPFTGAHPSTFSLSLSLSLSLFLTLSLFFSFSLPF